MSSPPRPSGSADASLVSRELHGAAPPPPRLASSARAAAASFHALRLRPGADLLRELRAYAARERLRAAFVATCVGSLSRASAALRGRARRGRARGGL